MEQSTGPSDAGELTAGPCDPRVGLAPPTCRNVACTGLLHHLLSGTPTRGGACFMAKLEHPSLGSGGGAEATTPTLTYGPACGCVCGLSSSYLLIDGLHVAHRRPIYISHISGLLDLPS